MKDCKFSNFLWIMKALVSEPLRLALVPDGIHLGQGHVGEFPALPEGLLLEVGEAAAEFGAGAAEGGLGIDAVEARRVDDGEAYLYGGIFPEPPAASSPFPTLLLQSPGAGRSTDADFASLELPRGNAAAVPCVGVVEGGAEIGFSANLSEK